MPSNARPRALSLGANLLKLGHVAEALRRYNDHLRDVRGLTSHNSLIDSSPTLKLCRVRNQGPALRTGDRRIPSRSSKPMA